MGLSGDRRTIVFQVSGDPARALATARQALEIEGFHVVPLDAWTLSARHGTKLGAFLVGAFAPFVELKLLARSGQPGVTLIDFEQQPVGCFYAGGVLGAKRSRNRVDAVRDQLRAVFTQAGVLLGETES